MHLNVDGDEWLCRELQQVSMGLRLNEASPSQLISKVCKQIRVSIYRGYLRDNSAVRALTAQGRHVKKNKQIKICKICVCVCVCKMYQKQSSV